MCPDSSFRSSNAEMEKGIEGCEDFDDNGAPCHLGSHSEWPEYCEEQELTANDTATEDNEEKEEEGARASTKEESKLSREDSCGPDVGGLSERCQQDKCYDKEKAHELNYMLTTDERTGESGTREQKGRGEEEVKTLTGESSVTTVATLTANTSQLKLTGQKKKQKRKGKSKNPPAGTDAEGNDDGKSDLDATSKRQSTGTAAAGQNISKEGNPTAATSGAHAVSDSGGAAATGTSSTPSSNKGKSLSPFSLNMHLMTVALLAVCGQMQGVSGILTIPPVNVLAKSGTKVRLRCSTDLEDPVYWLRHLHGASQTQTLYYGSLGFSSSVNGRFKMDNSRGQGSYDVIISNVTAKDAGVYVCQDDGGMGDRREMELVVYEYFNCAMPMPNVGFMGQNGIADDEIGATCSLKYHGNQKPRFHWRWSFDSVVNSTERVSGSTMINSTAVTLPREELNGTQLTCTATVSSDGSDAAEDSAVHWTSPQVTVLPASLQPGNVEQCKGSSLILVCNSECEYLEAQLNNGLCQCVATYKRSEDQRAFVFSVYSCAEAGSSWNTSIYIIITGIVGVAVVISAIAVTAFLIRKCKGDGKPKDEVIKPAPNGSLESSQKMNDSSDSSVPSIQGETDPFLVSN